MGAKNITVCISFDFDAISVWLGAFGQSTPTIVSRGEFGANVATPRILQMLEEEQIDSTWFIPGLDAETYPDMCKRVRDAGCEIGHHNYAHENPLSLGGEQGEREVMERGLTALDKVLGVVPRGYRSPAFDLSPHTINLLQEFGFDYDSSMMGDDFHPYFCRKDDQVFTDRAPIWGPTTEIVEIPVSWSLDDFPFTEYIWAPTVFLPATTDTAAMGRRWIRDLDFLIDEVGSGVFTLTLHPQAIGRASRLNLVRDVIRHGKERGVNFATIGSVVDTFRASQTPTT